MYRYHKPVKLKVFTRVEQFISNEIGYLTPNLECILYTLLLVASLPAEAPLEHNFRYPRIRELTVDNDAIALGHRARTF